ncbi:MAG TPA: serine/threonine protein kinase [Phycisphaerales bacterium]|nr:serine/threonine protein kinase [Phycisphaerales bacterium]
MSTPARSVSPSPGRGGPVASVGIVQSPGGAIPLPAPSPVSDRTPRPPVKHYEPAKPGTRLAGYKVLAEIGRGAASIIYLVQDEKTKQIWALKHVEKNDPKDQRFLDQAIQEHEVGSRIRHPAVRAIEKLIKTREKLISVREVFLVMEYVDGVSVERHPPKTFEQALSIFKQTAAGLAVMHKAGFVHADMKPNNIVVDDAGRVKVIDLGQACAAGTVKERIQGTPDYIAPEQVHRRAITPRTDIYNLGATMYWVLTQRHIPTALPKGDSLVSSLDDQFIEKAAPVRQFLPHVPEKLNDLIMECVEVDPEKRPSTMQEVHDRLDLIHAMVVAQREGKPASA